MIELNTIYNEDCLEGMKRIPSESINLIITDLPYQKTKNRWDSMIPLDLLWEQYNRIIKPNGAIILFGQDTFTAKVMLSNEKMHRYNLIWDKVLTSGFLNANRMPMRSHEDIMVFYKKLPTYNPQKVLGKKNHSKGNPKEYQNNNYGEFGFVDNSEELGDLKHPKSILTFEKPHPSVCKHPTEKSVGLIEWLIRAYSNEGELVLDSCMGSGTTAIACLNTDRQYIGFELDKDYYNQSTKRIEQHKSLMNLFIVCKRE